MRYTALPSLSICVSFAALGLPPSFVLYMLYSDIGVRETMRGELNYLSFIVSHYQLRALFSIPDYPYLFGKTFFVSTRITDAACKVVL